MEKNKENLPLGSINQLKPGTNKGETLSLKVTNIVTDPGVLPASSFLKEPS